MKESELHPSKRHKTLPSPPSPTAAKGKAKMEEEEEEEEEEAVGLAVTGSETCGICLGEGGRSAPGRIDSCGHYFCFVCIMEWAKVESRCPMCKLRFHSIARAPVPGLFPSPRVVRVPVRDQVYHPLGNESTGISFRYENVNCSYCHTTRDEELLLLCGLCDSASHTYCVGLGATVPEGDWYCPDCTISRDEHSKAQMDADCCDQTFHKNSSVVQAADSAALLFEIVSDEITPNLLRRSSDIQVVEGRNNDRRPARNVTSQSGSQDFMLQLEQPLLHISVCEPISRENMVDKGARTLYHCRSLHDRIQALRENWNALRAGSLDFSSSLINNGGMRHDREQRTGEMISDISQQMQSISSSNCAQMSAEVSASGKIHSNKDVNRAWKIMKIAKSMPGSRKGIVSDNSLNSSCRGSGSKDANNSRSRSSVSKCVISTNEVLTSSGSKKHCRNFSSETADRKCKSQISVKQKPDRKTRLIYLQDSCHGQESMPAQKVPSKASIMFDRRDARACSDSTFSSCVVASTTSFGKAENTGSSYCMIQPGAGRLDADTARRRNGILNDAKAEVQSLVKLNLKLLSRDQPLDVDRFKEVARVATHTILAACGLEHVTSNARSLSSSVCKHTEKVRQLRKSNLMPDSCRECFYTFVKDVVDSVFFDKNVYNQAYAG